jgi:hypothetical protein
LSKFKRAKSIPSEDFPTGHAMKDTIDQQPTEALCYGKPILITTYDHGTHIYDLLLRTYFDNFAIGRYI